MHIDAVLNQLKIFRMFIILKFRVISESTFRMFINSEDFIFGNLIRWNFKCYQNINTIVKTSKSTF